MGSRSWEYSDKASHENGTAAFGQDPHRAAMMSAPMALDGQRVIHGTFEVAFQRGRT